MVPKKNLSLTKARSAETDTPVEGYEIHLGQSSGADCQNPWLKLADRHEGAISPDGRVRGCYLHGLFASDGFRAELLAMLGTQSQLASYDAAVQDTLDRLADFIEQHLDVDALIALARPIAP